jgi:hypothetical protein
MLIVTSDMPDILTSWTAQTEQYICPGDNVICYEVKHCALESVSAGQRRGVNSYYSTASLACVKVLSFGFCSSGWWLGVVGRLHELQFILGGGSVANIGTDIQNESYYSTSKR